jgi:uncharacterized membrane protein YesL
MSGRAGRETAHGDLPFVLKVWGDSWSNLAGLLGANLLFLLWCAPSTLARLIQLDALALALAVVTVGPALLGLFRYAANLALDRPACFWRDSWLGFRSGFGAGVILSGVAILVLTAHRLALALAVASGMTGGAVTLWAAQVAVLALLALTGAHLVSLIALYHQGTREAFRNALLLALAHPAPTLGVVAAAILTLLVSRALGWGPLVILPALLAVLAVNTTLLLVHQHPPGGGSSS